MTNVLVVDFSCISNVALVTWFSHLLISLCPSFVPKLYWDTLDERWVLDNWNNNLSVLSCRLYLTQDTSDWIWSSYKFIESTLSVWASNLVFMQQSPYVVLICEGSGKLLASMCCCTWVPVISLEIPIDYLLLCNLRDNMESWLVLD